MIDTAVRQACALAGFANGRFLPRDDDPAIATARPGTPVSMTASEARVLGSGLLDADTVVGVLVPVGVQHVLLLEHPSERDVSASLLNQLAAYAEYVDVALAEIAAERKLGSLVGGGLTGLVEACADLTGEATALFDTGQRLVASAGGSAIRVPPPGELVRSLPDEPVLVPARWGGPVRRHILVPAGRFGWLVVAEHPSVLRSFDDFVARRTGELAGTEFAIQRRVAAVAWNARSALTRQLVRGTATVDDLRSSAEYLGVRVDARRILAYVMYAGDDERLVDAVADLLGVEVLGTRGSGGVLLLVEVPGDIGPVDMVGRVKAAVSRSVGDGAVAGLSSVSDPDGLARAYREAREVVQCIDRFVGPSSPRVLAADDLGPARLFVANSAEAAVNAYIDDVLGSLLSGGGHDLLGTLQEYFDSGRSVRLSAARLGVHENTVRLRLGRVQTATGFDVAGNPTHQLSVQTALLVLRLQGHDSLPSLGNKTADGAVVDERSRTA